MVTIIAAVSEDDALGLRGEIPWDEPADRARFKRLTLGGTLIMGRRTWSSLPIRPLPGRTCLVLSSRPLEGVPTYTTLAQALAATVEPVWIIGGARVFAAAYAIADEIDLTRVPVRIPDPIALRMPPIPQDVFTCVSAIPLPEAPHLVVETWRRKESCA